MPVFAMTLFAATLSISPGPVNLIILSTALNHGAPSALRFVTGATLGFTALLVLTGLGLSATEYLPRLALDMIALIGAGIILWFGYGLLRSKGWDDLSDQPIPGFWQGVTLQWLNPKAWAACLSGVALFNLQGDTTGLLQFATLYCVVCFFGIGAWAVLGQGLTRYFHTQNRRRLLNIGLGLCLIGLALTLAAPTVMGLVD